MRRGIYWTGYREGNGERFSPLGITRKKAQVLTVLGNWDRAEEIYRLALAIMERSGDRKGEAEVLCDLSGLLYYRSGNRESYDLAAKAEGIFDEIGDVQGRIKVLGMMGNIHIAWSDYRKALEYERRMEELAGACGRDDLVADAQRMMGVSHFWLGDTDRALEYLEKSRRLAEKFSNHQFLGVVIHAIGLTHRERKEFIQARPFLKEALSIFTHTGDQRSIGMALGSLAGLNYYLGEYDEALELYQRQVEIANKLGDRYFLACAYGDISAVYLDMGRLEEARRMAAKELALAQETEDRLAIGDSHYRLGLMAEMKGDLGMAGRHFDAAVEFGRQVQSGRFLPDYLLAKANYLYRLGDAAGAGEALGEARQRAADFNRRDVSDKCRVLELLISFPGDPGSSEKGLLSLAEARPGDANARSDIMYHLWKCTGRDHYRLKALEIFRKLDEGRACHHYRKMIQELEG